MPGDITAPITDEFERYCSVLKSELSYVEDGSFSWDDAVGLLIIQLKNTDSLNKARRESHATQIQLTSEREAAEGARKTEDFFPTLTLNSSFKSWRISIPARVNLRNVEQLGGAAYTALDPWRPDSIQIRRRLLNDDGQGNGNPTLQICYGDDLMPLREQLNVDDYLVIVKRKAEALYDAFGVKSTVDLGSGKNMYLSSKASTDSTSFMLGGLMADYDTVERLSGGTNILLYGVPGSGKSWTIEHEYCHVGSVVERLVFHPDYTNADFIGQILPVVDAEKQVTYEFTPGPFTTILRDAYMHPMREYILIIEEVNRGNAPAIFGEVFQLLDRTVEPKTVEGITYPIGTSEYGITHKYMAEKIYGDPSHKVRIPSNLSIVGTMNTSDQNVFTLDTAFQRRWRMRLIENNFDNVRAALANAQILDTEVTWKTFCEKINAIIVGNKAKMASAEDKRLGVYFVHENDVTFDQRAVPSEGYTSLLTEYNDLLRAESAGDMPEDKKQRLAIIREALMHNRMFPEKVIKYLWDDAFKFNPEALFDTDNMESLEQVIRTFVYSMGRERFKIFKPTVRASLYPDSQA
jgi:muconolactone delta-isomerase